MDTLSDCCLSHLIDTCQNLHAISTLSCVSKRFTSLIAALCATKAWSLERQGAYGPSFYLDESLRAAANNLRGQCFCFVLAVDDAELVLRSVRHAYHQNENFVISTYQLYAMKLTAIFLNEGDPFAPSVAVVYDHRPTPFNDPRFFPYYQYVVYITAQAPITISPSAPERKFKFYYEYEFYPKDETTLTITDPVFGFRYAELRPYKVLRVNHTHVNALCSHLLYYATRTHKVVLLSQTPESIIKTDDYAFFPLAAVPGVKMRSLNTLRIGRSCTYSLLRRALTEADGVELVKKKETLQKSPYLISSLATLDSRIQGTYRFKVESRNLSHVQAHLSDYIDANLKGKKAHDRELHVVDLRQICRTNGLPAEGKRSDLLRRLSAFLSSETERRSEPQSSS